MNGQLFLELVQRLVTKYPDYQVVICNCTDCRAIPKYRDENWAVNHAERKIYL